MLPREFKPKFSALSKFENANLGLVAQVHEYDEKERAKRILETVAIGPDLNPEGRRLVDMYGIPGRILVGG